MRCRCRSQPASMTGLLSLGMLPKGRGLHWSSLVGVLFPPCGACAPGRLQGLSSSLGLLYGGQ